MTGRHSRDSEEDVQNDPHVAGSRDGDTVGRTAADDDIDAGETGAEARSEDG